MIHTEDVVIASEGSRRFDGHLARPAAGAGPGLLIFSEMWGVAPRNARWPTTTPGAAGARSRPTCSGGRSSPASCRSTRPTRHGSGCRRSTSTSRPTIAGPRCSGCAPRPIATARSRRSASAWAGASRSWRRRAPASMPPSGSTRSASPSISTRCATWPCRCSSTTASTTSTFRNPRSTRSPLPPPATAISRSSSIPGAGHGFFNRTFSPDDVKAVETATAHIDRFLSRLQIDFSIASIRSPASFAAAGS